MIELLTGPNEYAIHEYAAAREREFLASFDPSGLEKHYSEDITPDDLAGMVQGGSLFAAKKLVILSEPSANKTLGARLPAILDSVPQDTELLLVEPKPDKRLGWYKSLIKTKRVREFGLLSSEELARWAKNELKARGVNIDKSAAGFLVERAGTDQWRLKNELDKLALGGRAVTEQIIEELVEPSVSESVFALTDAVVSGHAKRAQDMYTVLSRTEVDPHQFIGLLSWQVNIMLIMKTNQNKNPSDIARAAGLAPFVASKSAGLVRTLTLAQIRRVAGLVQTADLKSKRTKADAEGTVRLLIDQIGQTLKR